MTEENYGSGVQKIVSGGQTGVDRAALDVALELGIPHGGWCPRGRRAEDGPLAECYQLVETAARQYHIRTEKNVVDSEGTLILYRAPLTGGSELTRALARRHGQPCLTIDLTELTAAAEAASLAELLAWLAEHEIGVLNVAGPRESTAPGIYEEAARFLRQLFAQPPEGKEPSSDSSIRS